MVAQDPLGRRPTAGKNAGDVATLARAVRHAADMPGVRVINISLINCIPSYKQVDQAALGAALRYAAIDKDIVVVAAAGNTGESNCESNPLTDPNRPDDPRNWAAATTISTPCYWQPYVLSVGSLTPRRPALKLHHGRPLGGNRRPRRADRLAGQRPDSGLVDGQPSNKEPLAPINGTSFAAACLRGRGPGALGLPRPDRPTNRQPVGRLGAQCCAIALDLVGAGVIDPVAALTWDIPEGEEVPAQMPVVRVPPPAPPPPDGHLPRLIGTVNLRSCGRSANRISLIRHTRPGESRRRTGENRPRTAQVDSAVPRDHYRDCRWGIVNLSEVGAVANHISLMRHI